MLSRRSPRAFAGWACAGNARARQRGLSIVELMVGVAVGLFVVAATAMLAATQLGENRRMLLEAQIQQDLRATADIVTRELRRAGYYGIADQLVWVSPSLPVVENANAAVTPASGAAATSQVDYKYSRPTGAQGPSGFKLESGRIKSLLTLPAGWQELTDPRTLEITRFAVTPLHADTPELSPLPKLPCPKLCPDGTTNCWPTAQVREFQVEIEGRAKNDPSVVRSVRTTVRLRNDALLVNGASICPA